MKASRAIRLALCTLLLGVAPMANAFIVDIGRGPRQLYFRVGDPGTEINTVSVSVASGVLGNGVAQQMRSDASQTTSEYDDYVFCNLPNQVYVGGYYRRPNNNPNADATLTIAPPASLTNATGQTIPFSQISWTSSGNGDGGATQPFPSGNFSASASIPFESNSWRESCHSFSYANSAFVAAGTYTGQVVYTLSAP
jgi:hypothetical protein